MTFVYYNPKTNTIEKRQPVLQPQVLQIPYLLNVQPQDINYAMRNTNELRSYAAFVPYPEFLKSVEKEEEELERYYSKKLEFERSEKEVLARPEKETLTRPFETKKSSPAKPNNGVSRTNDFIMMEDFHEGDIGRLPEYYRPNRGETIKQPPQNFEETNKKSSIPKEPLYYEEESRGDFRLIKPEDLELKYRPEGHSMRERGLNARSMPGEQEKTILITMNRPGRDNERAQTKSNNLERELKQTEQDTIGLEERKKKIWEEIERRKFQVEADEILKKIDTALGIDDEDNNAENEDRYQRFLKENQALYAEADRLKHDAEDTLYVIPETGRSGRSERSTSIGQRRSGSSGVWKVQYRGSPNKGGSYSKHNYINTDSKAGRDMALGRGKFIKAVTEEKTKNVTKINLGGMYERGNAIAKRRDITVKNPKKVEHVLKEAKAITDLY